MVTLLLVAIGDFPFAGVLELERELGRPVRRRQVQYAGVTDNVQSGENLR